MAILVPNMPRLPPVARLIIAPPIIAPVVARAFVSLPLAVFAVL